MNEIWKDVTGWTQYYEVSNLGNVRNKITKKLIKGDKNNCGYYRVCLYNKNHTPSKQRFFRHRLVAIHFIPNPNNYDEVNHINGNKEDNSVDNLEWVNRGNNELHCRKIINTKEYKPFRVIFEDDSISDFDVKSQLSKILNVTTPLIKMWLHNKSKTYLNYGIKNIYYIDN